MEYDLFTNAYQGFVNELNSSVVSNYAGFVGWIAGPLRTGMVIYIILLGYAIMRGAVQYPFREYVYRSLMLAALYWAVTSLYGASIAQMIVTGLPNEFASIIGNSPNGVGGSFDTMWARVDVALIGMQDATKEYAEQNASMWDLQGAATAIILCIGATIIILLTAVAALFALAVGFVIVLYALFALACLAVVGPIFVGALLFDSTRSYFFSWLGSVLNFLMLSLFALLLVLVVAHVAEAEGAHRHAELAHVHGSVAVLVPRREDLEHARRAARQRVAQREAQPVGLTDAARALHVELLEALPQLGVGELAHLALRRQLAKLDVREPVVIDAVLRLHLVVLEGILPHVRAERALLLQRRRAVADRHDADRC